MRKSAVLNEHEVYAVVDHPGVVMVVMPEKHRGGGSQFLYLVEHRAFFEARRFRAALQDVSVSHRNGFVAVFPRFVSREHFRQRNVRKHHIFDTDLGIRTVFRGVYFADMPFVPSCLFGSMVSEVFVQQSVYRVGHRQSIYQTAVGVPYIDEIIAAARVLAGVAVFGKAMRILRQNFDDSFFVALTESQIFGDLAGTNRKFGIVVSERRRPIHVQFLEKIRPAFQIFQIVRELAHHNVAGDHYQIGIGGFHKPFDENVGILVGRAVQRFIVVERILHLRIGQRQNADIFAGRHINRRITVLRLLGFDVYEPVLLAVGVAVYGHYVVFVPIAYPADNYRKQQHQHYRCDSERFHRSILLIPRRRDQNSNSDTFSLDITMAYAPLELYSVCPLSDMY